MDATPSTKQATAHGAPKTTWLVAHVIVRKTKTCANALRKSVGAPASTSDGLYPTCMNVSATTHHNATCAIAYANRAARALCPARASPASFVFVRFRSSFPLIRRRRQRRKDSYGSIGPHWYNGGYIAYPIKSRRFGDSLSSAWAKPCDAMRSAVSRNAFQCVNDPRPYQPRAANARQSSRSSSDPGREELADSAQSHASNTQRHDVHAQTRRVRVDPFGDDATALYAA